MTTDAPKTAAVRYKDLLFQILVLHAQHAQQSAPLIDARNVAYQEMLVEQGRVPLPTHEGYWWRLVRYEHNDVQYVPFHGGKPCCWLAGKRVALEPNPEIEYVYVPEPDDD